MLNLKNDGKVFARGLLFLTLILPTSTAAVHNNPFRNILFCFNPPPRLVLRRRFDSLKWDVKKCEDIVFDLQVKKPNAK